MEVYSIQVSCFNEMSLNKYVLCIHLNVCTLSHGSDGGWRPIISTAAIASAKYFYQHVARRNTITQARQNVA